MSKLQPSRQRIKRHYLTGDHSRTFQRCDNSNCHFFSTILWKGRHFLILDHKSATPSTIGRRTTILCRNCDRRNTPHEAAQNADESVLCEALTKCATRRDAGRNVNGHAGVQLPLRWARHGVVLSEATPGSPTSDAKPPGDGHATAVTHASILLGHACPPRRAAQLNVKQMRPTRTISPSLKPPASSIRRGCEFKSRLSAESSQEHRRYLRLRLNAQQEIKRMSMEVGSLTKPSFCHEPESTSNWNQRMGRAMGRTVRK